VSDLSGHSGDTAQAQTLVRRRQTVGLVLIAAVILLVALLRAPAHVLFPPGWWRF
jgi:hypothetical protein